MVSGARREVAGLDLTPDPSRCTLPADPARLTYCATERAIPHLEVPHPANANKIAHYMMPDALGQHPRPTRSVE